MSNPLPSRWSVKEKPPLLEVTLGYRIKYVGSGDSDKDAASVKADHPIPPSCGLYYFEIKVLSKGRHGYIGVGLTSSQVPPNRLPGWDKISYGYHGDDGNSFCSSGTGQTYGPQYSTNDVVGCCINFLDGTIFFTKNGIFLGVAFNRVGVNPEDGKAVPLYPCVGLRTPGEEVEANFGQKPFVFNIEEYRKNMRKKARQLVDETALPATATANLHQLVAAYLAHQGYLNAAKELCKATGVSLAEPDQRILTRKAIWDQILAGNIDAACAMIENEFPGLLERSPTLRFEIKCRQFVEMAAAVSAEDDAALDHLVAFGRDLRDFLHNLGEAAIPLQHKIEEVFSIMAYPDPSQGPMAYLLDPSQREVLAEAVNSALIAAYDLPAEAGLRQLIQHSADCLNLLRESEHGVAAFLNFDDFMVTPQ